ncbi:hypothetical protein [Tomitella fengzijianii]|uniref:Mce-associated membrane protein n=1 Tax=Tomitella fengzijianii TaxID=2597660 RepID=A0A516X1E1_9ACTN|nr:hypothetical protein [Tomitella fengzijianii]QDQ96837.1 hypothetical protein FO059_05110 [Tomitella fengzijianii]
MTVDDELTGTDPIDEGGTFDNPRRGRARLLLRAATVAVIVALAAVVGWLAWGYFSEDASHTDAAAAIGRTPEDDADPASNGAGAPVVWGRGTGPATAAVRAAVSGTESIFGYTYDKAEQQLGDASNALTGDFQDEFREYVTTQLVPAAKEKKASVAATVVGAAPVRFSDDSAEVLVFMDQVAKTEGADQTAFTPSQMMVSLGNTDGKWLISDVQRIAF